MADIRDYLRLSKTGKNVKEIYITPNGFSSGYSNIAPIERKSYLRHFIVNNKPFAFDEYPLIYEQLVQYLADNNEVYPTDIKLIGSAKTGFSISESHYGRTYQPGRSDLDFSIINQELFYEIRNEFELWGELYRANRIEPRQNLEQIFWPQNLITGANLLKRGFMDTKYIPNRIEFPKTQKLNGSLFYIKKYLADIHSIKIKEASISIYYTENSFIRRLKYNTEMCLSKLIVD